ncbi:DEAD/DEAH box helicase family protein [Clostridium thermobutyricum]|uniref:DEAD/DEAH box helicase family protein n=1 Tax=Clostridium thermobutyricum TaxID=29372 RepID=UPI003F521157
MEEMIRYAYAKNVKVAKGNNPRNLYEHQKEAIHSMNKLNKNNKYSSLLVLPTGGGKTATAAFWLLKEALNNNKKILWVAHRHILLEQAAETFKNNAYSNLLYNISSFNYRIVSGKHDNAINIKKSDNILIISKDSAIRNLDMIGKWFNGEDEIYLIIDEAHHSTAKTYRNLIEYVNSKIEKVKLLGLTATPFRTNDNERGLLSKIYEDGIVFKVDLKDLIKKEILSRPEFEECKTEIKFGHSIGLKAIKRIENFDSIPQDIADKIGQNTERNKIIVNKYLENSDKYGQTIIFAINRLNAFALRGLFQKAGIQAEVIVSGTRSEFIGIDNLDKETEKAIKEYRLGKMKVLINVNILTEGIDLPETKTVFLTRPTVSTVLMTQMVGRALRGEKAGGTKEAYIVSFIDNWEDNISWVTADTLINNNDEFLDSVSNYKRNDIRVISILKIEEFAKILDDTVDTTKLENINFMRRIPLGLYIFTFIDDNNLEKNHQVLIYDSTKKQYEEFIDSLPLIIKDYNIIDEYIDDETMEKLLEIVKEAYFDEYMLPKYDENDIINILKYYVQKECKPKFIPFNEIDRQKLNLAQIAQEIVDKDMRRSEINEYSDKLWNNEDGVIRIYFNKKMYFKRQLDIEIYKIEEGINEEKPKEIGELRELNKLSLYEISEIAPEKAREIKDKIYLKFIDEDGTYYCNKCGYKSRFKGKFQIDHIKPRAKGGLTLPANMQLLCTPCNRQKGDYYE